jgi:hypothetical protein
MSNIVITLPITIHKPGARFAPRIDTIGSYGVAAGNHDVEVCLANVPFEIE